MPYKPYLADLEPIEIKKPEEEQPGYGSDLVNAFQSGAIGGAADIAQGVTLGSENAVSKGLRDWAQSNLQDISPEGLASMQATGLDDDLNIKQGSSLKGLGLLTAQGLGSIAPSVIPGAVAGRALAGATKLGAGVSSSLAHGATGAAMIGGSTANQVIEEVRNAAPEKLANNKDFANIYWQLRNNGLESDAAFNKAREEYANKLGTEAAPKGALIGAVSMGAGNPLLEKVIAGKAGTSRLANMVAGSATESIQEFGEGYTQQVVANKAAQEYDKTRKTHEGALGQAATGAIIGGGIGGGLGGITFRPQLNDDVAIDTTDEASTEETKALPNLSPDAVITFADGSQARESDVITELKKQGLSDKDALLYVDNLKQKEANKTEALPSLPKDEVITFNDGTQARKSEIINEFKAQGLNDDDALKNADVFIQKSKESGKVKSIDLDVYHDIQANKPDEALVNKEKFKQGLGFNVINNTQRESEIDNAFLSRSNSNKEKEIDIAYQQKQEQQQKELNDLIENIDTTKKGKKLLRKILRNKVAGEQNKKDFVDNLGFKIKEFKNENNVSGTLGDTTLAPLLAKALGRDVPPPPQFDKPTYKIKPDAQKIVANRSVGGIGLRAAIDNQYQDGGYNPLAGTFEKPSFNISTPDSLKKEPQKQEPQKETSKPKRLASVTDKSVRDYPQQVIVNSDGDITVKNKSGRTLVSKKTFNISEWEAIEKSSFGNKNYLKREFVRKLKNYKSDGTPESESVIDRIIDSQVIGIEKAIGKLNDENRGKTGNTEVSGKTDAEPGVHSKQSGTRDTGGDSRGGASVQSGKRRRNATDSGDSQRHGVSTDSGLAGHQTDVRTEQNVGRGAGQDKLLSGATGTDSTGRNNFVLTDKPNIELTPAKRRDINNKAVEILQKPVEDVTEDDKEILRQYTGAGGLSAKDSADKGDAIFNQHYTDYTTIREIYRAIDESGLKPKRILEPSVGSGNFVGHKPNAQWDVVDVDSTNTEIVKRLYPDANVFNESFETFKGKNYDLIVSNVPFASYSALPRKHANTIKPAFKAIHNFFFAQSLDKLKPGGVMAFMTSTGTMDGTTEAKKLRQHLVKQADVLGAYRLPMGTQKKNASTEVMIDIIFLQKRPEGVKPSAAQKEKNSAFVNVVNYDGYPINEYFVKYPDAVLGDLHIGKNKTAMGKTGWIVTGEPDYSKIKIQLNDYSDTKSTDVITSFRDKDHAVRYAESKSIPYIEGDKPFFKDGVLFDKKIEFTNEEGSILFGKKLKGINAEKIELLQEIEKTLDPALVEEYKSKFKKPPHKDRNLKAWAKTHKADKVLKSYLSLFDEDFNLSEIFTEEVRFKDSGKLVVDENSPLLDRAEAEEDADGRIDTNNSKLLSKDDIKALVDSGKYAMLDDKNIQNAWLYYSGNIYKKLDDLKKISDKKQREKQRKKLEAIKPEPIPFKRITITGKESWLPVEIKDALGISKNKDGEWIVDNNFLESEYLQGLYKNYLNNNPLVKRSSDDTQEEYNETIKSAQRMLHDEVLPQIKTAIRDAGLADLAVDLYNRAKNFFAEPHFDGSSIKDLPKKFRGKVFKLMEHQQKGVERAVYNKKGVIAFAPGLGKTPTAIIVIKQLLQKGVVKKPLFIVPANTIPQWEETARELYPDAKIFEFPKYKSGINKGKPKDWQAMTAEDKEKMVHDLSNNRYDYVFISTNLAQKFTIPKETLKRYINDLVKSISKMEKPDEELTKSQIKAKQQRLAKIEMLKETMMKAYEKDAESGFDMEKLGFDAIVADEVQYYKNIGMQSEDARGGLGANVTLNAVYPKDPETGKPDKTKNPIKVTLGSSRSYDFRFKTQYISENNNGNNVFLLTGTPTPNKPLELMTLLQHLDVNILKEYGIENVSDFVNEFFEVLEVETTNASGDVKFQPELVAISNIDALKKIITRYVDYLPAEAAKDLKRPKQKNVTHTILRNDTAEAIFHDIQTRLKKAIDDALSKRQGTKIDDLEPIIKLYLAGRDASIDTRLYQPSDKGDLFKPGDKSLLEKETRENYSKIAKTVSLIAKRLKEKPDAGQLVFLDRLKFPNGQGSTHAEIRDEILSKTGLKPEQVVFVNAQEHVNPATGKVVKSGPKPERLQAIIDAYNAGDIKVVIGNTAKLGVGVDLQKYTTDIYMIDKPYRPDEIEQRINRGVRQGNVNDEVVVHTFITPGSFDELSDRIVANKQGFNDVFWKNQEGDKVDIAIQETPDAYDAAIAIETDPVKKRALEIERELTQAHRKRQDIENKISTLAKREKIIKRNIKERKEAVKRAETAETPEYAGMKKKEKDAVIKLFKEKLAERIQKYKSDVEQLNKDLIGVADEKKKRQDDLQQHKDRVQELFKKYVVDGRIDIEAVAKDIDTKKSTAKIKKTGSTVEQVKSWIKNGIAEVVQSATDLPVDASLTTEGLYDPNTNKIYLVADNITKQSINAVLAHELLHARIANSPELKAKLDSETAGLRKVFNDIKAGKYKGRYKKIYDEAMNRVNSANTPAVDEFEEFLAYSVTAFNSDKKSVPARIRNIIQRIIATIKTTLLKAGFNVGRLTPADLNALATSLVTKTKGNRTIAPNKQSVKYSKAVDSIKNIITSLDSGIDIEYEKEKYGALNGRLGKIGDLATKYLTTLDNLARNNKVVRPFLDKAKKMQEYKDEILSMTNDQAIESYLSLGDKGISSLLKGSPSAAQRRLGRALYDGTLENKVWSDDDLKNVFKLKESEIKAYRKIRQYMDNVTKEYLSSLLYRMGVSITPDGEITVINPTGNAKKDAKRIESAMEIADQFKGLKGYFPLMRFGNHTITVRDSSGEVVYFAAKETKSKAINHANEINKKYNKPGYKTSIGYISEASRESLALDPRLLSVLAEVSKNEPGFSDVLDEVEQQMLKMFSTSEFKKRFIHRKGIPGFERDVLRTLASYGWSSSNYVSKMRYVGDLQKNIDDIDKHQYPKTVAHLQDTLEYIKSSKNEYNGIKAFTFMYYMGLNAKSALVNLTQIPVTLAPFLANKFGDAKTAKLITEAMKDASTFNLHSIKNDNDKILSWAHHEGLTYDSYLGELIGIAQGNRYAKARYINKAVQAATMLFSKAEMYNRRVSVLSAYNAVKDMSLEEINALSDSFGHAKKQNKQDAIREFIRVAVTKTQFDYAKFNKPAAFRGWASVPMQFKQFLVNYIQFIAGNGGGVGATVRSLAAVAVLSGFMGLPGADDMKAAIEYAYNKITGKYIDIELEGRKALVSMSQQFMSDDQARAFARAVLNGVPSLTPFDISYSTSVGNIIPGLAGFFERSVTHGELEGIGEVFMALAGPTAGIAKKTARGIEEAEKSGEILRLAEKSILPVAVQNLIKAIRVASTGVDRNYTGKVSIDFKPSTIESLAQALSFSQGEKNKLYLMKNAKYREAAFLKTAHQKLLTRLSSAMADKDSDRIREAKLMIKEWNNEVPAKWRLSPQKIKRSIRARSRHFNAASDIKNKQLQREFRKNESYY
jgi:hypothetical protein